MTSELSFEQAREELYAVAPRDFTARRKELVSRLRDHGRRDDAAELQSLRKPTLAAWAVNQVARRHREEMHALIEAGNALREQASDPDELRLWGRRLRERIEELRDRAAEALRELDSDPGPHRDDVEQTLATAAAVPEERAAVEGGWLDKPLPPAGFDALTGLAVPEPPDDGEQERRRNQLRADSERLAEAASDLEADLAEAAKRRADLRSELEQLEARIRQREERLARTRDDRECVEDELRSLSE